MSRSVFLRWLNAVPFFSFEIHMSDGESVIVKHPELVSMGASSVLLMDPTAQDAGYGDYIEVSLLHICRLERLLR